MQSKDSYMDDYDIGLHEYDTYLIVLFVMYLDVFYGLSFIIYLF